MELKVGDVVEFKKYEDMAENESLSIPKDRFPKSGKIREVTDLVDDVLFFFIEGSTCIFSSKSIASKKEESDMQLKAGDIVEFKKYEDMNDDEIVLISKEKFPKYGKVKEVYPDGCFFIEESPYWYSSESVARVISDVDDIDNFNPGDEVWVKTTVNSYYKNTVFLNPIERFVNKDNVLKIVKRKEPEHFIVKEDYYGMYIGIAQKLVSDKSKAKIYSSRNTANEDAADMHLNAWDVIPYGD